MKLSEHFTLAEFTKSETAIRLGLKNQPDAFAIENIKRLVDNVLEPLRKLYGPIQITSGYRSLELNTAIGGSRTSQHMTGEAADIEGRVNSDLFRLLKLSTLPFDQLIWEFGDKNEPAWVHVSHSKLGSRRQVLRAYKEDGKTLYTPWKE